MVYEKNGLFAHFLYVVRFFMHKMCEKIENLISPIIEAMNYRLWGTEIVQSGQCTTLRIYIDTYISSHDGHDDGKEQSVNINDCSLISKQIGAVLDVENIISDKYILEVSSPGLNKKCIDKVINIRLQHPIGGVRNFVGKIKAVFDDTLELSINDDILTFELANITKATLNF
jgi:ribosome maturation factor RimP